MDVDALVALKPYQPGAGRGGERLADLRLADTRLALEQQRLLERHRQEDGDREAPVGEVGLARQGLLDGCGAVEAQSPAPPAPVATRTRASL